MAASLPLVALLAFAFALRVGLAVAFPNLHHADELFQYLEQGHRMAFGYGVIPWEYRDGARSWMLPGLDDALARFVRDQRCVDVHQ